MKYSISLPVEIWHTISSHLERRDHLSLILVNRTFYAIFLSRLFTAIVIEMKSDALSAVSGLISKAPSVVKGEIPSAPPHIFDHRLSVLGEPICSLLEMLHSRPVLRGYIRRCELRFLSSSSPSSDSAEQFDPVDYIISLIGNLPHLEEVILSGVNILVRHLVYLCSRPNLALGLLCGNSTIIGRLELHDGTIFTANYLKFVNSFIYPTNNPTLSTILAGGSLRELIVTEPPGVITGLFKFFADRGSPLLPHLQILELAWFHTDFFSFFESTPNLIELRLMGPISIELGKEPLGEGILPKLQSVSLHYLSLNNFVPSRPVRAIYTGEDKPFLHATQMLGNQTPSFDHYEKCFGSTGILLQLTWTHYTGGKELFQYIAEYNPQLTHLEVDIGKVWKEHEVYKCARLLKGLGQLRILYLKASTHSPALQALVRERKMCVELQTQGCPYLTSVSFRPRFQWNRDWKDNTWIPSGERPKTYIAGQLDTLKK
ncbi:hypothetical protein CPB86DRAFT_692666 [Serendipita vermifera]|nr:hypothetical protein CPB86DRAFT_692666 [Serendipita vermifera]